MRHIRLPVAAVGGAALLSLAACTLPTMPGTVAGPGTGPTPHAPASGPTTPAPPPADCAAVGPMVVDRLTDDLTVAGGGTISRAVYAPVAPPRRDPTPWFAVAATLEGPGLDSLEVLWVTNAHLAVDNPDGVWFAMDDMAREFSLHSPPPAGLGWDPEARDLAAVRGCLR